MMSLLSRTHGTKHRPARERNDGAYTRQRREMFEQAVAVRVSALSSLRIVCAFRRLPFSAGARTKKNTGWSGN